MLEAWIQALSNFGSLHLWLFMALGILVGMVVGVLPGISPSLVLALTLPFVLGMKLQDVLVFMMSMMAVQFHGGSISAILINVPGEVGNAATSFDGYPMTRKGEGGRAIGAALSSAALGSIFSVIAALICVPLLLPLIMALRTADMVFIVLMGLAFIGVLSSGSMLKGLISGLLGIMLSFIGIQIVGGEARFSFGTLYLYDGLPIVPFVLAFFAVPEMINLAASGESIASSTTAVVKGWRGQWRGIKDTLNHLPLVFRSSIVGYVIGVLPALGGSAAGFVAYGQAKQTSKHPETFGTGNVEGVIGPESSNHAKEAGDLLCTLALGIPGSSPYVLILAAFIIMGLVPGPEMLTKHLDLSLTMMLILVVAAVIAAVILFPICTQLTKIAYLPSGILVPSIMGLIFLSAYLDQQRMLDTVAVLALSVLGLAMKKYGYDVAVLCLGFVLGPMFENYFLIALSLDGPFFFLKPISMGLIIATIAVIFYSPLKTAIQRKRAPKKA